MRKANRAVKAPLLANVLPDAAPEEVALALASVVGVPGTVDGPGVDPEVEVWKPLELEGTLVGPALLEALRAEPLALEESAPGREPLAEALPPPPIIGGGEA